jgi:hypothetical protein
MKENPKESAISTIGTIPNMTIAVNKILYITLNDNI